MRSRIFTGILLILSMFAIQQSYAADTCNQTFPAKVLRYGKSYTFFDLYNNDTNYAYGIQSAEYTYIEPFDYNQGTNPAFALNPILAANNFIINAHTVGFEYLTATSQYEIKAVPVTRSPDNFQIQYKVTDFYSDGMTWIGPNTHVECQPYEISWCGDGVTDSAYAETCDDGATNGQPGKCNTTCNGTIPPVVPAPVCGNGVKEGTETCDDGTKNGQPSMCSTTCDGYTPVPPVNGVCGSDHTKTLTSAPTNLCTTGTPSAVTGTWNWSCIGANGGTTASCSAQPAPVCGDGIKNGTESCDPADTTRSGWGTSGCNTSCQPTNTPTPVCDPTKIGTLTTTINQGYCQVGAPSGFGITMSGATQKYTWKCDNTNVPSVSCNAEYTPAPMCGNGIREGSETCDAGSKNGQPGQCNATCNGLTPLTSCTQTFNTILRHGGKYDFSDSMNNASGYPVGINTFTIDTKEESDFNGSPSFPEFEFTPKIVTDGYLVANGAMKQKIVQTKSGQTYDIIYHPQIRSYNNLFVKYTFDAVSNPPYGSAFQHSECANYAISWCGDGVLDTEINPATNKPYETCDDGAMNGQAGKCNLTCDGTTTPDTPICLSTKTGPQTTPVRATDNLCQVGTVSGFVATGTSPINYSWSCGNAGKSQSCTASYIPVTPPPTAYACAPTKTGTQTTPVSATDTLCSPGKMVVGSFTETKTGNKSSYAWKCSVDGVDTSSVACAADYTPTTPPPTTPSLTIHKYAKTLDAAGDTQTAPVSIALGESFSYFYVLENASTTAATEVVVKDTLPEYLSWQAGTNITIKDPSGTDVTADWTCTKSTYGTTTRIALVCTKKTPLPANSGKYTFTVPVTLASNAKVTSMQNVVYACAKDQANNPKGPNGEDICGNPNPPPPPPTDQCDKTVPGAQKDPACIVPTGSGFDLSIKKYIGSDDADTAPGVTVGNGQSITYRLIVTNKGPLTSSGVTTVRDVLPTGVLFGGTASWTNGSWSCTYTTATVTIQCTSEQPVAKDGTYDVISFPVSVTAGPGTTVINYAHVNNPKEDKPCLTDKTSLPTTASTTCTNDTTNSNPAVFTVPGGGGGGASNVGKKCVNGVAVCATYNSITACINDGIPAAQCYSADAVGQRMCADQSLSCSTGPGGPTPPGGCVGPTCYVTSNICGDGVLNPTLGEECDVKGGAPWCNSSCKIIGFTTPGDNPITDLWMTIPVLSNAKLGYTWLDGETGKIGFSDYKMVLGVDTKAFTLADTVGFGIKQKYSVPLMIEATKGICLKSEGTSLNSERICTTFGDAVTNANKDHLELLQTLPNGKQYVILGSGDYQYQNADSSYSVSTVQNPNNIKLFVGSTIYPRFLDGSQVTLNSAFFGKVVGNDGMIGLYTDTGVDLVKLDVRVSNAVVSSVGSSANRKLEEFINKHDIVADFLGGTVINNTSTTTNNSTASTTQPVQPITVAGGAVGPVSADSEVALVVDASVNGNPNILAVNGDLTIETCTNNTFVMTGIRTVIVTGNIIIKCNIAYDSNDTTSSWAWIAKNGNIKISNGTGSTNVGAVTNIAGVYVAIKETTGGDITYADNNTTTAILRVDGSLYGNAEGLFKSRLYARATGAYEMLTTGTVLNYSNRALVNPPPLLSQYLGTYQVQRVIQ